MTLVGLIRSVKESTTRIDYELDDMTGPLIEIKQFVDGDVSGLLMFKKIFKLCFLLSVYMLKMVTIIGCRLNCSSGF